MNYKPRYSSLIATIITPVAVATIPPKRTVILNIIWSNLAFIPSIAWSNLAWIRSSRCRKSSLVAKRLSTSRDCSSAKTSACSSGIPTCVKRFTKAWESKIKAETVCAIKNITRIYQIAIRKHILTQILSLLLSLSLSLPSYAGWHDTPNQPEGFYFYGPIKAPEPEEQPVLPKPAEQTANPAAADPIEQVKALRETLERQISQAVLDPTPQNLYAAQITHKALLSRAERFGRVWMQNVYQHPELDHSVVAPVNQLARQVYFKARHQKQKETIHQLSRDYGLFFFFSSDCAYCHEMAPIIQHFAEQHHWKVLPISVDGKPIPAFPQAQTDNGIARQWQVQVVPSVFAVNPKTGHRLPLAQGLTSLEDIETRVMALVGGSA